MKAWKPFPVVYKSVVISVFMYTLKCLKTEEQKEYLGWM